MSPCEGCPIPHICVLDNECAERQFPSTLAEQVRQAQAIVASWPKAKRDSVQLEGNLKYNFPSYMGQ